MSSITKFQKTLKACEKIFEADRDDLLDVSGRIYGSLPGHMRALEKEDFLFSGAADIARDTGDCVDFLRRWHVLGDPPSLAALCGAAAVHFEIKSPTNALALMMAAILGEQENNHPYHNNNHFRKVTLQLIRMIGVHNRIYSGTARGLSEDETTLLLVAACIHDLGHDGLGNTVKGVFQSGRLERQSFDLAWPYLEATGFEGAQLLKALILATDVSPLNDPTSPVMQMKAAYRFHYLGENKKFERLNLSSDLKILEESAKASLMACLLHEADMATSAGLEYRLTQYETVLVRDEIGTCDAKPQHIVEFLELICQRKILSDAGQKLYAANMARIYALAEEDVSAGNALFPKAQHTEFILSFGQNKTADSPKTIN